MTKAYFALLLAAAGQTLPPAGEPTGAISGVVHDTGSGDPVANVEVWADRGTPGRLPGTFDGGTRTATDEQGRYSFKGLTAGQHRIDVYAVLGATGFPVFSLRLVNLAPGQQLTSIDFALPRVGTISGRVLDRNREPAPGMWVSLIAREYSLGTLRYMYARITETNDQGEFTVKGVPSGRAYLLMAAKRTLKLNAVSDSPANPKLRKQAVVPTYYPGTTSIEGAQPLVLLAGEHREGIDITLERSASFCMEGVLRAGPGRQPMAFQIAASHPTSGASGDGAMFVSSPSGVTGADGRIRICDLYPAEYQLIALSDPKGELPAFWGSQPVAITDRDITDLAVSARARVSVPGEVAWEGTPPDPPATAKLSLRLVPMTRAPWRAEMTLSKPSVPGVFSFGEVAIDEYSLRISDVPSAAYVKDITYAGRSIRYEPLRPGSAIGDASVKIILAGDGGTLAAKVSDKDGNPVADSRVIVMPASAPSEAILADAMVSGQTDQNGVWTSNRIAPGKYYVLASRTPVDKSPESIGNLWRARLQAKEIEVGPKATVEVTLSPATIQ